MHVSTYWGNQLRLVSTRGGLSNQSGIDFCTYNGNGIVARVAAEDQGSFRGNINFYCNGEGIAHSTTLRKIFHVDYLGNAYLYGNFYAQQTWMWSDRKLKENIVTCSKAIEMINALRGVTYDTKDSIDIIDNTYYLSKLDSNKTKNVTSTANTSEKTVKIAYGKNFNFKKQYGLIAQEVETVLPEAVMLNKVGIKTVNYNAIIPLLVEAIKEQNVKIENMEARLRKLEKPKAGARTDDTKSSTEKTTSIAFLYQNSPNPFSQETTIKYSLPETVQD
ncbi:MAG: tail fiber domain-containing protein, partial [Bacteroidetes bacterium]